MRPTPNRRLTAAGALIAAAALLSVGVQVGTASAQPSVTPAAPAAGKADPGALPKTLSPPNGPN